jgi:hypothetical protein
MNQRIHNSSFLFLRYVALGMPRPERGEEPSGGEIRRLIQIPLATLSLAKIKSESQGNSA